MSELEIRAINGNEAKPLLDASDKLMESLYPAESNHLVDMKELLMQDNYFIGAFIREKLVGCAAMIVKKEELNYGEIKRLFVDENYRGQKIAMKLMQALEDQALNQNYQGIRLETGIHQQPSIHLYEKLGYQKTKPFGNYVEDPFSVFMEKKITTTDDL
ncbi:MAG: GNAT family N-acetyltransferase [Deltaproteobacteria bacterium]|nr:GNAT family N-acetyltransferase [Deltaproteobacteria bacterium]